MNVRIILLFTALILAIPGVAFSEALKFPRILNYESLERLPKAKRVAYLNALSDAIVKFEVATAGKISQENHATLEQLKEFIAVNLTMLPDATAEVNSDKAEDPYAILPTWDKTKNSWTCRHSGVVFNTEVGTCVSASNSSSCSSGYSRANISYETSSGDTSLKKYCVPNASYNALAAVRRDQLKATSGAPSVASNFIPNANQSELAKKALVSQFATDEQKATLAKGYTRAQVADGTRQRTIDGVYHDLGARLVAEETKDTVIGGMPELQQNRLLNGDSLNAKNPAVSSVTDPKVDGTAGQDKIDAAHPTAKVADTPTVATGAGEMTPVTCVTNKCPMTDKDVALARTDYATSRKNGKGPECIIGGQISNYPGQPEAKKCSRKTQWDGADVCHAGSGRKVTVCNPILWCKNDAKGAPAPFCLPVTATVSRECAAAADPKADCGKIPDVPAKHDKFISDVENLCGKDVKFMTMFCNECKTLADSIVKANGKISLKYCDANVYSPKGKIVDRIAPTEGDAPAAQ